MEQPKTRPDRQPRYGGAEVPAEAAQHMDWAREQLARLSPTLREKYADTWALGFISSVIADAMQGRDVPREKWARMYAVYLVAQEVGRP